MRLEWKHIECVNFDLDFDLLLGHCTFVKSRFANERAMARKWDAGATAGLTEEQRHKFYERHGDEGYYVNDLFPNIQWSAMFVAAFNLFERTLNDICTISGSVAEANIHPKDITGRGTERAQTYLSKAQYVHKPFRPSEWRQVKEYATVRNVLSHTYGV